MQRRRLHGHRITVREDGRVTLEDLGWGGTPPKVAPRQRSMPADDAVTVINEFLKARFLEASGGHARCGPKGGLTLLLWVGRIRTLG
jgi:hypothetical protein